MHMTDETLPPEMLPIADTDEISVVVCRGTPDCDGTNTPCQWCIEVDLNDPNAVENAVRAVGSKN